MITRPTSDVASSWEKCQWKTCRCFR